LAEFQAGAVEVVVNCMVLTEGTDLPRAACILHAKPTKSATLYEQMTGRGLRLFEGKRDCVVIDIVDIAKKHSLMAAPSLYGLPPRLVSEAGRSLSEMAAAWEEFSAAHPGVNVERMNRIAIEQLAVMASTFSVWEIPSLGAFAAGRALHWVKTAADTFRIQYPWRDGTEVVQVAPDLVGQYAISCTFRAPSGVRQRTLATGLASATLAAEFAERYVLAERPDVTRLVDRRARWRRDVASEKQKRALRWRRIPFREDITKGEASALLDLANARGENR
jgi:hypothetical protein